VSKRRTRRDKELAALRREQIILPVSGPAAQPDSVIDLKIERPKIAPPSSFENTTAVLYAGVKRDLLKTLISIALALALELSVYYFLYSAYPARIFSG